VQLPKLGLDYDTYGPYMVAWWECFMVMRAMHWMHALEELDGVMELLRASSDEESHSSNDDVWDQLKWDILEKHEEYTRELQKVQEKQRRKAQLREQE
jgi:hypothetical protein